MCNPATHREAVLRGLKKLYLDGASIDHVLGEAYNAGQLQGSGLEEMTELDSIVLSVVGQLETPVVDRIAAVSPELGEALRDRRLAEINAGLT